MEVLYIKRNTTPVLPIRVEGVKFEQLDKIIFGFKSCLHKNEPIILKKTIIKTEKINSFQDEDGTGFTVNLELTTEETFSFKPGDLFIDVYPVINGNKIVNTGTPIRYEVIDTVLDEVIK